MACWKREEVRGKGRGRAVATTKLRTLVTREMEKTNHKTEKGRPRLARAGRAPATDGLLTIWLHQKKKKRYLKQGGGTHPIGGKSKRRQKRGKGGTYLAPFRQASPET